MLQFDRLRIHGFKSFVDRTELEIAPGLNGIVGPNGCGKSNLVEALRWVMGESSAKKMRGGGMEDVIFNGTDKRAARNIAEVSLLLDNASRTATSAYNGSDEIEVIRRIERDKGSNYKINGKNQRARDVQMLFADTVTGANSPALVSQGQVAKIINAKPLERRLILEESAGISGLYARRHEAELRLRAAENNMTRIQDVLGSMESRLNALKRQARQAGRYRNINAQIRQLEILIAYLEWRALHTRIQDTNRKFGEAESIVAEHLAAVSQLGKTLNTQSEDLPTLRRSEAELGATLQTQKLTLQRLEDEIARMQQDLEDTQTQLTQTKTDLAHEENVKAESEEAFTRIEAEQKNLIEEENTQGDKLEEKHAIRAELESKVETLEAQYNALMQSTAQAKAEKNAAEKRVQTQQSRLENIQSRIESADEDLTALKQSGSEAEKAESLAQEIETLETTLETLKTDSATNQTAIEEAGKTLDTARDAQSAIENKKSEFDTEISMLEDFLNEDPQSAAPPVLNDVKPDSGFEKALSRALGDSLMASLEREANTSWQAVKRQLSDMPALPDTCETLLPHVRAPKALELALSQIGVVNDDAQGESLLPALAPGQSLVSRDGSYWRWDGYCIKATATDRHAKYLEQKNTLHTLLQKRPEIETLITDARTALQSAQTTRDNLQEKRSTLSKDIQQKENTLRVTRSDWNNIREAAAKHDAQISRLEQTLTLAREDEAETKAVLEADRAALKLFDDIKDQDKEAQLESLHQSLTETRSKAAEAVRAYDLYVQEQNTRKARLQALGDERVNLQNRTIRARERIKSLSARDTDLSEKLKTLIAQPKTSKADQEKLLSKISETELLRDQAAEKLTIRENEVNETNKALREAERTLSDAKESRAHAQATMASIKEQLESCETTITEKFQLKPQDLPQHAAIDIENNTEDLDTLRSKREKLTRERDSIGPVNLRAEDEATELESEVGGLLHERNDLTAAIEELRSAINTINAEARTRLLAAFDHVNAHFQRLFTQLFGGGKAHLALIDDEETQAKDPLGAGLEIFAQPPGKALQSLSLLSGGEQTLASIALIFAMFLTNPSPICVLDEIDAPLDDANVDRVCDLLDDIAARGETRFLIITHHRLTMARMDRLYGVTMGERGVSQLVSVDLQQSFSFLDEAA
ncbi:MAG: chromosome segregation protein SMC [Alphaproteobacteria bacterium]